METFEEKEKQEEEKNPYKLWNEIVRDLFLTALEALKETKANTAEWDLIWNTLHCYKTYAETKEQIENLENQS